jgi:hypothetical protein
LGGPQPAPMFGRIPFHFLHPQYKFITTHHSSEWPQSGSGQGPYSAGLPSVWRQVRLVSPTNAKDPGRWPSRRQRTLKADLAHFILDIHIPDLSLHSYQCSRHLRHDLQRHWVIALCSSVKRYRVHWMSM